MLLTPTYHVFRMYVPFQDATLVPVRLEAGFYTHRDVALPRVDAIAAKDSTGKLWLAVTNLDANRRPPSRPLSPASPPGRPPGRRSPRRRWTA